LKSKKIRKRQLDIAKQTENSNDVADQSGKKTKKKKKKNYYFGMDVQRKIVEYQITECPKKKEKIYEEFINPAFTELVHSLVSVYGFKSSNEDIAHLKSDCVSFLYETIYKWSPDKKSKAFSYFNVVAKNWLTIQSRRLLKNVRRSAYIDDPHALTSAEKSELFDREYVDPDIALAESIARFEKIIEMITYIEGHLKDSNDIKCCFAIKKVFNSIEDLEFFNKRAIFVYLREISGLNSTELSSSLSSIRKIYRKVAGPDKMFDVFG
jgi:hypothetical protein